MSANWKTRQGKSLVRRFVFAVPDWSNGECVKSGHMTVKGTNGDLSFKVGHSMNIGTISCPWQVEVEVGQMVKFDLFSFLPWKQDGTAVVDRSGDACKYNLVIVDGSHHSEVRITAHE